MYRHIETRRIPFQTGGKIKYVQGLINKASKRGDTVPAILQVGEMVIPKPYVAKVERFLKENRMPLPMKKK